MTKTVTIFGGSGFIGNHIVRRLSKLGYRIILPTSNLTKTSKLKIYGHVGQILPIKVNFSKHTTFKEIISLSDCIINLKTIWVETKNITYKKQIYDLNKSIINYIKNFKEKKYIFFSGIGIELNNKSKRTIAIANVEKFIQENLDNFSIVRPSIVIGNNDKFISRLLPIFKFSLFVPIFGNGEAKIQPTYVDDVAYAVERLVIKNRIDCNIYELGGNELFSYKKIYKFIANTINKKRIFIYIPFMIAKIFAYFFEKFSMELINREQIDLFKKNNIITRNFLTYDNLGISSSDIKQVIINLINK